MLLKLTNRKKEIIAALVIPLLYGFVAFATIGDYGVSPDEPGHFRRGQAYLYYFLTGKKKYTNLPKPKVGYIPPWPENIVPGTNPNNIRRSYYQSDSENGEYFLDAKKMQSHPPINDTLAALTNYIFYQKLGILDDVDSYHVFSLTVTTFLILVVYLFARINFGVFAGLISALSLALYPVFLGEAHFNIKDPPETAFFTMTIFFFWLGIVKKNVKFILASALSCALALGTKFNIVFIPFIIVPWLFLRGEKSLDNSRKMWLALIASPAIVIGIFFVTNPNLWEDTLFRLSQMLKFYLSVGTTGGGGTNYQPGFLFYGFNTYPILAVIYKTPLLILLLSLLGFIYALANIADKGKTFLLFLLWFIVPILRVSLPGMAIYGGIRHIFEYIPAMAILAGLGASKIAVWLHGYIVKNIKPFNHLTIKPLQALLILSFMPITLRLVSIHPNENVYFNPLIGGLKGAKSKNFPYWGSSLGNTYLQGVNWVNKNAKANPCVTTPIALMGNIPYPKLRKDVLYHNTCQSGVERKGEYAMDMVYQGYFNDWYSYAYYATYLNPVYEVKVDGVVIFQVFKNDLEHTKAGFVKEEEIDPLKVEQDNGTIFISLAKKVYLSALNMYYDVGSLCKPISDGFIILSTDGVNWTREPDNITVSHTRDNFKPEDKKIERRFAAKQAKFIKIVTNLEENCQAIINKLKIYHHPDLISGNSSI